MDSAKYVTLHNRIYINIGKNKIKIRSKICNEIKCAKQYTENLINNYINRMCKRNVQTGCTGHIHQVYKHSSNTDDENSECFTVY